MKAEKDDGYKCPRCDDHIAEQFYCRDCGYVPDWRQIETDKTHREGGIIQGAEMSYLNSEGKPNLSREKRPNST